MGPEDLSSLLCDLRGRSLPDGYAGVQDFEDVGLVPFGDTERLLFTADFFTPIVDDPYEFGAIAAANALSDIYAKGGTPLAALNLAAFPQEFDTAILREILRGGVEKALEGGAPVVGGHTVKDREIKYGMAVIGRVGRDGFLPIGGAQLGQELVLTKAIGTGILSTALKQDRISEEGMREATASMLLLNREAGELAKHHGATSATDVTGYGLLGHLLNMVRASSIVATIHASAVPLLSGALELAKEGCVPGGCRANLKAVEPSCRFIDDLDSSERLLLADPQTSGGLLIALSPDSSGALVVALRQCGYRAEQIGRVTAGGIAGGRIVVER